MSGKEPDRYAVIGHPVAHSRSPAIHAAFARQTGQALVYERIDAPPEAFAEAVRRFAAAGGKGLNVTVPHKEAAFELADELGREAAEARAVNTLTLDGGRVRGDNTDGLGFVRDLCVNEGVPLAGRRVLIFGAGGAARGVVGPVLTEGPRELVIANRTPAKAEALARAFAAAGPVTAASFAALEGREPFDVVVNATSVGLAGDTPAFPANVIGPGTFCYDMVYGPGGTPFVRWALSAGARRAVQGLGMLVEQAAESFRIWRGVRPATEPVLAELRRELEAAR
ncbi:MAG TPA: shikimate dehydrogenase [Gammaproteobacteria bacterium]